TRDWLRNLSFAAALIVGFSGAAPRVRADGADDARTDKTERAQPSKAPMVIGEDTIDANALIKSDFQINVSVAGEPEPSGTYTVDALGSVNIRYAGVMRPVSVKGMTAIQAQDAIAADLKTYIKNPTVKVTI